MVPRALDRDICYRVAGVKWAWLRYLDRHYFISPCLFFLWKRSWPAIVTLIVAVPGGMFMNELLKILVHRPRPFLEGSFVDWSGYSFASVHTIGATLLYGQLALFIVPAMKARHWRALTSSTAIMIVLLVGFSRICLGRALSDGCARRDHLRYSLVGILFGRGQTDASR